MPRQEPRRGGGRQGVLARRLVTAPSAGSCIRNAVAERGRFPGHVGLPLGEPDDPEWRYGTRSKEVARPVRRPGRTGVIASTALWRLGREDLDGPLPDRRMDDPSPMDEVPPEVLVGIG